MIIFAAETRIKQHMDSLYLLHIIILDLRLRKWCGSDEMRL